MVAVLQELHSHSRQEEGKGGREKAVPAESVYHHHHHHHHQFLNEESKKFSGKSTEQTSAYILLGWIKFPDHS